MPDTLQDRKTASPPANETLAVALAYKRDSDNAPTVLASGRGGIAEQILEVARARDIHVREDADLVQLLRVLEVGSEIPVAAFAAVAEILVYVYRATGALPDSSDNTVASTPERAPCP